MKTILVMLCLFASAFGQTIQITDKSPSGSPLSFRGSITFSVPDTSANCAITAHNNSSRAIVALVVQMDVVNPEGERFTQPSGFDHFFAPDDMLAMMSPAGKDFNPEYNCSWYSQASTAAEIAPAITTPWMTVTAVIVQFNDGSVWGDPAAIAELMLQRNTAIAYLQSLAASTNLADALAPEPPLFDNAPGQPRHVASTRELTWEILRDKGTPQAQATEINRRLAIAQERAAWLK